MPLVSVLIPAYNAGPFIELALEGVRMQMHGKWEVIVVEDGSKDETQEIVARFAASVSQRVCYERSPKNRGVSATRNRAMALARGEVIAFLDADDQWKAGHLQSGLATLERGADLCFSGFELYDAGRDRVTLPPLPEITGDPAARLFESNFIQTSSLVMLRAETARRAGEFDPGLAIGEDCDYWMRVITGGGRLACTGERTCVYAKHGASAMAATLRVAEGSVKFYRKHLGNPALPPGLRRNLYSGSLVNYGRLAAHGDARLARSLFLQAWRLRPWDLRCAAFFARTFVFYHFL